MLRLGIIFVLYNTDLELLNKSIESIERALPDHVDVTFFIHNNSFLDIVDGIVLKSKFKYFYDGENIGLARAQNRIIEHNINNFDYFLTSDQDSIYGQGYVSFGLNFLETNVNCGCVVPVWRNIYSPDQKFESQLILVNGKLRAVNPCDIDEDFFNVTHAICSGSIMRSEMFRKLGFFNEDFFIDWIDNEWMWRAEGSGFDIICFKKLQIFHQWGEPPRKFFSFYLPKKSELRVYFTFRNGLALVFHDGLKSYFKFYVIKQLLKYILYVLLSFNFNKYIRLIQAMFDFRNLRI